MNFGRFPRRHRARHRNESILFALPDIFIDLEPLIPGLLIVFALVRHGNPSRSVFPLRQRQDNLELDRKIITGFVCISKPASNHCRTLTQPCPLYNHSSRESLHCARSWFERLLKAQGWKPYRCQICGYRFIAR